VTKRDTDAALAEVDGLTRVLVRPPAILGAGETSVWNTLRPAAIRDDERARHAVPEQTFPWVHVDDLAAFAADVATGRVPTAADPERGRSPGSGRAVADARPLRLPAWSWFLACTLAVAAACLLFPPGRWMGAIQTVFSITELAAVCAALWFYRPAQPASWRLLALGIGLYAAAATIPRVLFLRAEKLLVDPTGHTARPPGRR